MISGFNNAIIPFTELDKSLIDDKHRFFDLWSKYDWTLVSGGQKYYSYNNSDLSVLTNDGRSILHLFLDDLSLNHINKIIVLYKYKFLNISDRKGRTPLYFACKATLGGYGYIHGAGRSNNELSSEFSEIKYKVIKLLLQNGAVIGNWSEPRNPIKAVCCLYNATLPSMILIARQLGVNYWKTNDLDPVIREEKENLKERFISCISGNLVTDKELTIYLCLKTVYIKDIWCHIINKMIPMIDEDLDDHFKTKKLHSVVLKPVEQKDKN